MKSLHAKLIGKASKIGIDKIPVAQRKPATSSSALILLLNTPRLLFVFNGCDDLLDSTSFMAFIGIAKSWPT
jgi:hypothetical protein